jgi:hypothetical protein
MWGLLIANQLDQSLRSTNYKYWVAVRSNLLHSFLEVPNCVGRFTSHGKLHKFGVKKPISWAKLAHFDFFALKFYCLESHLSTVGDALTPCSLGIPLNQPWKGPVFEDDIYDLIMWKSTLYIKRMSHLALVWKPRQRILIILVTLDVKYRNSVSVWRENQSPL